MLKVRTNKCVVVLGPHRGGTSIAACLLHNLGVDMGEVFMAPDDRNPTGFFEDIEFLKLHDKIIGGNWERPVVSFMKHSKEYEELLVNYKYKKIWGIKDPKMCLFFQNFLQVAKQVIPNTEIIVIDIERNLNLIVNSLCNKKWPSSLTEETATRITKQYIFCKEQGLKFFNGRVHNLKHENLMNDPQCEVLSMCEFVGVPFNQDVLSWIIK